MADRRHYKTGIETLADLFALGVERGLTIWPEWGPAFTMLDKGGSAGHPGIENRPMAAPKTMLGKRFALHAGAHIGGRAGKTALAEGFAAVLTAAKISGWIIDGDVVEHRGRMLPQPWVHTVRLTKGDRVVEYDIDAIPRSAIIATAVLRGSLEPTSKPAHPWQFASDPADPDSWAYGWILDDLVPLAKPIPCPGLQGFWPLKRLVHP